ncbi:patatin-like phospholipase family protein [Actinobaculum suis]|uniref:patatin-like phospholipase family protein n=1 Tax=Actinobaculum suis TaxID=1657 RepID=UPI00069DDF6A|nr:patatin-like phospholipase family protein [Actinobaculum suis]
MKVALVLGSGGARGWAHIGVIEELEARGHEIVAVSGSSIGAVVGGAWAAGKLPELKEWITGLTKREVRKYYDWSLGGPGLLRGEKNHGRDRRRRW